MPYCLLVRLAAVWAPLSLVLEFNRESPRQVRGSIGAVFSTACMRMCIAPTFVLQEREVQNLIRCALRIHALFISMFVASIPTNRRHNKPRADPNCRRRAANLKSTAIVIIKCHRHGCRYVDVIIGVTIAVVITSAIVIGIVTAVAIAIVMVANTAGGL